MTQADRVPEKWRLGEDFVPKGRYVDPEFLALEYERLFPKVWQMACREEEIPAVGSYLEYSIGDQSILVVRSEANRIQAFHNTCIHRGSQLVQGMGRVKEFRCPFHGWRYALGGQCTFIHCADEFDARPDDFKRLRDVRCERWGGWVFVNMDPDAEPLLAWLDPLPSALGPFEPENMRYAWHKRTILPANWKTAIDAFIEGYHTPATHPQYIRLGTEGVARSMPCEVKEYRFAPYNPTYVYRNHSRFIFGQRKDAPVAGAASLGNPEIIRANIAYQLEQLRALNNQYDLKAAEELCEMDLGGKPLFETFGRLRRRFAEEAGVKTPALSLEQTAAGQGDWHMFPTMVNLVEPGSILGYRSLPNGDDPDSCVFDVWSLYFWPEGGAPHVELDFVEDWTEGDWGEVLTQDFRNMGGVQRGMHSRGFEGHWLNKDQEMSVHNAHRIADRFLFGTDD
ncbi:MAG: aromatic ring-hydroxylating dioxygenase subunit alpha [Gemmatimonadota bacterium]|jgi:phenylpropionate dioxygenase-like ring-hydroxylating dioxygenase large terminal subunit